MAKETLLHKMGVHLLIGDFAVSVAWKNLLTSPVGSARNEQAREFLLSKGFNPDRPPVEMVQRFGVIVPDPVPTMPPADGLN
jgi:hypothetical protein